MEIGWTVARAHWGKGYAAEAARAAVEWAHDQLGAGHIVSLIDPGNEQSIRVAEKLGGSPD
jgi:RimJ/RimL family protein N-acetyltransferase